MNTAQNIALITKTGDSLFSSVNIYSSDPTTLNPKASKLGLPLNCYLKMCSVGLYLMNTL